MSVEQSSPLVELLAACGIDETKANLLKREQANWFGAQLGNLLGTTTEYSGDELAKHILFTNKIHKVEKEINRLYEEAKARPIKENDIQRTNIFGITWGFKF